MDKAYWLGRQRSAVAMAHAAVDSATRLIHYDLAGRYGLEAAKFIPPAFMLPPPPAPAGAEPAYAPVPLSPPDPTPATPANPFDDQETRR